MKRKIWVLWVCLIGLGWIACETADEEINDHEDPIDLSGLEAAFEGVLEGDNFTLHIHETTTENGEDIEVYYLLDGETRYYWSDQEDEAVPVYFFTEAGERFCYALDDYEGVWKPRADIEEFDVFETFLKDIVWEASHYHYEAGVYTLNDAAFKALFGETLEHLEAAYTVTILEDGFEVMIDDAYKTTVYTFTRFGNTVLNRPDFLGDAATHAERIETLKNTFETVLDAERFTVLKLKPSDIPPFTSYDHGETQIIFAKQVLDGHMTRHVISDPEVVASLRDGTYERCPRSYYFYIDDEEPPVYHVYKPVPVMTYRQEGHKTHYQLREEEKTIKGYAFIEAETHVRYERTDPLGTWFKETNPEPLPQFSMFLDTVVWDASSYWYAEGEYTLKQAVLDTHFEDYDEAPIVSYTVQFTFQGLEIVIEREIDEAIEESTFIIQEINTTQVEIPDIESYEDRAVYETLNQAFNAVLEGDNFTFTATIMHNDYVGIDMYNKKMGDTLYHRFTFGEDETVEVYRFVEEGMHVRYGRVYPDGEWVEEIDIEELDTFEELFEINVWEASQFIYEDGVYTLNDEAFTAFFGRHVGRDEASYTVMLEDETLEVVIWQLFNGEAVTYAMMFDAFNVTTIELPDFTE